MENEIMENDVILRVKDLKTFFYTNNRCNRAINGVSFDIRKGKTLSIVGESGCGKSVTASSIMQLLPDLSRIEEGEITYFSSDGEVNIEKLPKNGKKMRSLRGSDIAMIFQDPMTALNPVYTIGFQIVENLRAHMNMSRKDAKKRAIELLAQMGIPNPEQRVNEYPHQFSGGMRQRAMIAMALACDPVLLIADEPTTSLDVTIQAQILELMKKLLKEFNSSLIMITHDLGVIAEVADRIAVMYAGKIVEYTDTRSIFYNPLHPYTYGLLTSIPRLDMDIEKLDSIPGLVPDPLHFPEGCKFHPRCPFATAKCQKEEPLLKEVENKHLVRCWHSEKVKEEAKNISFTGRLAVSE